MCEKVKPFLQTFVLALQPSLVPSPYEKSALSTSPWEQRPLASGCPRELVQEKRKQMYVPSLWLLSGRALAQGCLPTLPAGRA